jgi:hypothetical protein
MAHRLALYTRQTAEYVPNICEYQRFLTNLFYYFKKYDKQDQQGNAAFNERNPQGFSIPWTGTSTL